MNRTAVKSSNISSIGYDASTQTLEVEFGGGGGGVYQYEGVTPEDYSKFAKAPSPGKHLHKHIKGAYPRKKQT